MTYIFGYVGGVVSRFFVLCYKMYGYFGRCLAEFRHIYFYRRQVVEQCYNIGVGSL